jgi:ribosomal protein S18 acetylase RimI-like enzyme
LERHALAERMRAARDLFAEVEPDEFYLSKIGVAREVQGAGHGRALAREYLETGARQGFRRLSLDVFAEREGAIALYRSPGFEQLSMGELTEASMRYVRMVRSAS